MITQDFGLEGDKFKPTETHENMNPGSFYHLAELVA
jgi:hypothetical protein